MVLNTLSKSLVHYDESGFDFVREMLSNNPTSAINFDRIQKHPTKGYIIFEYLLCEEQQLVSPYTSHPSRYWTKNMRKFLSLWRVTLDLDGTLYLVNYAKKGTKHEDEVLLIEVQDMDSSGIVKEKKYKHTRDTFSEWFIQLNKECLLDNSSILCDIYLHKTQEELNNTILVFKKYKGESLDEVYSKNPNYLRWICENSSIKNEQKYIIKAFLAKKEGSVNAISQNKNI